MHCIVIENHSQYLFLRQKYQRKRIASSSQNEPRRIYDIANKIDENSSWMTKRSSMTLLSDSSDTETDNEEEEMIAELNHLQKSVDLGGIIKNLLSYLPILMVDYAETVFGIRNRKNSVYAI